MRYLRPSGARKRKRLNRVFDAIGFMYPDYRYPPKGQKRKSAISEKNAASAAPSERAPKRKKVKVLTHRPRYIEPAVVPEFGGDTSSATEAKEPAPMQKIEEPTAIPKAPSAKLAEPKASDIGIEGPKISEISSPSVEVTVPKAPKGPTTTPKRKIMVNVLDALETIKTSSTPRKTAEAPKTQSESRVTEAEAAKNQVETEAGPLEPTKEKLLETREKKTEKDAAEQILPEKTATPTPEASSEVLDYIIRHASGKRLTEEEIFEAKQYARELKYPKGALVFNGTEEDDFLYCLPDNKELSVCRERARSIGFPKLEASLCAMKKDDLADSLAYNSLKVQKFAHLEVFEL
jgi:hypothetical protein